MLLRAAKELLEKCLRNSALDDVFQQRQICSCTWEVSVEHVLPGRLYSVCSQVGTWYCLCDGSKLIFSIIVCYHCDMFQVCVQTGDFESGRSFQDDCTNFETFTCQNIVFYFADLHDVARRVCSFCITPYLGERWHVW